MMQQIAHAYLHAEEQMFVPKVLLVLIVHWIRQTANCIELLAILLIFQFEQAAKFVAVLYIIQF